MANRVIVKHAMVVYRDEDGAKHTALRSAEIELTDEELERLRRHDAVVDADDEAAAAVTGSAPVQAPATPDVAGAVVPQPDDAGSDEQTAPTAEDVDPESDGTENPVDEDTPTASTAKPSTRRRSSSST